MVTVSRNILNGPFTFRSTVLLWMSLIVLQYSKRVTVPLMATYLFHQVCTPAELNAFNLYLLTRKMAQSCRKNWRDYKFIFWGSGMAHDNGSLNVVHFCVCGSPSGDLLFFLALQCMWGPKCMTYAYVYATWVCPMGLNTVSCLWSLLFKDCMSCVLFFGVQGGWGVRAEDIIGVRVTKGSYCIILKSVLSWQEFL